MNNNMKSASDDTYSSNSRIRDVNVWKYKLTPRMILPGFYMCWLVIWISITCYSIWNDPMQVNIEWSNIVMPLLIFVVLIISSYFAGEYIEIKCRIFNRIYIPTILLSAALVAGSVAIGLLIILLVGYLGGYKFSLYLLFWAPFLTFVFFFFFSGIFHCATVVFLFQRRI